jgi:hypothetical protein
MEKKTRGLIFAIVAIVLMALITLGVIGYLTSLPRESTQVAAGPAYQTLLPANTSIETLGGWSRVSPPESEPVYAFTDTINDVAINVSQQLLPESFRGDVSVRIAELAKSYNATTAVDVSGTTVYIGTSARGPQSVLFTKRDLLILIKSDATISPEAWATYVTSLR